MANILIYYPYNQRSVEQQSVMEMLVKKGHKVTLLTTCERGYIHDYVEKFGVTTASVADTPGKFQFYKRNLVQLNKIIKCYNIEIVIAHQQIPAIIAGILKKIRKFKLAYVRHNSDESYSDYPLKAKWLNKIANWLTPVKVAPSSVVKNFWILNEHVPESQIIKVHYGYNFNQYEKPVASEVGRIRFKFPSDILVLSIARLMPVKRHKEMLKVIKHFSAQGINIKML
ncbi:MAG: glycosyltransferase family 4 protein [Bacteroidota bacterium]